MRGRLPGCDEPGKIWCQIHKSARSTRQNSAFSAELTGNSNRPIANKIDLPSSRTANAFKIRIAVPKTKKAGVDPTFRFHSGYASTSVVAFPNEFPIHGKI